MKLRVIVTGATGMVGEGVLHECLNHPEVEQVLSVSRKPSGVRHPKLRELLHADFHDLTAIQDQLAGYNACFFCLGVSAVGLREPEYRHLTYDLTLHFARTLLPRNPGLTFCYVSGAGTDGTGRSRQMWARVKGQTENDLLHLGFARAYMFRPGYLHPTPGLQYVLPYYKYLSWLYPVVRRVLPQYVSTLRELGLAMVEAARRGYTKPVLEVPDIVALART
ncbi:NAD-dependent epimerase/dehydratase family protein [Hymenobacter weizhouensis]|uniref:NAD-dependent epimerase/dehydratase family protein n=1 Tax=Hymenobacter sp. YIM 151500-1 TaxID=2987689 RepID=UPI00222646CB|nr:NAD-dependent epimerase/dehydratase family protein [Hymenobacter sp. YIM 151500-1]UYZ63979.1 NAD-dependent epimerase/dehydratase family protein [Hymenobacter sp. YIM 151500-1]